MSFQMSFVFILTLSKNRRFARSERSFKIGVSLDLLDLAQVPLGASFHHALAGLLLAPPAFSVDLESYLCLLKLLVVFLTFLDGGGLNCAHLVNFHPNVTDFCSKYC